MRSVRWAAFHFAGINRDKCAIQLVRGTAAPSNTLYIPILLRDGETGPGGLLVNIGLINFATIVLKVSKRGAKKVVVPEYRPRHDSKQLKER
jgi:hypothetical protein